MSILDSVINPADFQKLDPAIRKQITLGVKAGAASVKAVETKRISPAVSRSLAAEAKVAVKNFNKTLG